MRQALERNGTLLDEEPPRDLILGAPALLGIFFAVAAVCALCFGFGYSQGHGWRVPGFAAAQAARPEPKPLGGVQTAAPIAKPAPGVSVPAPGEDSPADANSGAAIQPAPVAHALRDTAEAAHEPAAFLGSAQDSASSDTKLMVQIAAVSRAADAQTLASALKRDGFAAMVRTSSADKFFHVQVGPFATLGAAKAMRARLADSGYNAFVKP